MFGFEFVAFIALAPIAIAYLPTTKIKDQK